MNRGLTKTYTAGGAITRRRIVAWGSADRTVIQAAAATAAFAGISDISSDTPSGGRVDVTKTGVTELELGGNVTRGDPITADAQGRGITAAPATGANVRIIGFAEVSGALGDFADVWIEPGLMQG